MTTHISDSRSRGGAQPPRTIPAIVAGLAAALALGAALLALAGNPPFRSGDGRDAPPPPAAVAVSAEGTPTVAERIPVFLVASAEEAGEFRRLLAALAPDGQRTDGEVLVAGSPEDEADARLAIRSLQERYGVSGVSVVDLRSPATWREYSMPPCDGIVSRDAGTFAC